MSKEDKLKEEIKRQKEMIEALDNKWKEAAFNLQNSLARLREAIDNVEATLNKPKIEKR